MENGSLEDHIFRRKGRPPLSLFLRFRIAFEVACGLAFLHSSKPEAIIHRDIKPGNILLDKYFVSKIGDVGLAKIISAAVPDNITEYQETVVAGFENSTDLQLFEDFCLFQIFMAGCGGGAGPSGGGGPVDDRTHIRMQDDIFMPDHNKVVRYITSRFSL